MQNIDLLGKARNTTMMSQSASSYFILPFLSTTCLQLVRNLICNSFYSDLYAGL